MAYYPHRRLSFGGTIRDDTTAGDPIEIWNCSVALTQVAFTTDLAEELALAEPLVEAFIVDGGGIHGSVVLEYVKYNDVGADGAQVTDPTVEHLYTAPEPRSNVTSNAMPLQVSCRVSLDNGTRARRARGGFYVPRPALTLAADGRWASGSADSILAKAVAFLGGLNTALEGDVCVASGVDATNRIVNRIRVGRVPDTIRTRRNALLEGYSSSAL